MASSKRSIADLSGRSWYAYLRKSKGRAGIARQRRDINTIAARLQGTIVAEFVDTDSTAFSKPDAERAVRDKYQVMLTRLRADRGDNPVGVLAWHADRLHRNVGEAGEFVQVCAGGLHPVETARSGGYDLTTSTGRKRFKQDALDAEFEVDHLTERVQAQKDEAVAEGRWLGGARPFGFEADGVTHHPVEAALISAAYSDFLRHKSLNAIAAEWNLAGTTTTSGNPWVGATVRLVLARGRNAGVYEHNGHEVRTSRPDGKAEWDPIVSEEVWRAVKHILADPARRTTPGPTPKWLGTGIYLCGICGGTVTSSTAGGRTNGEGRQWKPAYRCGRERKHISRNAVQLDAYVESTAILMLDDPRAATLGEDKPPDMDGLRARLAIQEAELLSWRTLARELRVTAVAFAEAEQAVLAVIADIKADLAAAASVSLFAEILGSGDVPAFWRAQPLGWRRAAVDRLVTVRILRPRMGRLPGWRPGESYLDTDAIEITRKPRQG